MGPFSVHKARCDTKTAHTVTVPNPAFVIGQGRSAAGTTQQLAPPQLDPHGRLGHQYQLTPEQMLRHPPSSQTTAPPHATPTTAQPPPATAQPLVPTAAAVVQQGIIPTPNSSTSSGKKKAKKLRWVPSSGSAVWALFLLIPALFLMISTLGQSPFSEGIYNHQLDRVTNPCSLPPRVFLFDVENCKYSPSEGTDCKRLSFSDAIDQKLLDENCVGCVRGSAAMSILSIIIIPVCIVFAILEVRMREPFSFAVVALVVPSLLVTGLAFGLPVSAVDRKVCKFQTTSNACTGPSRDTLYNLDSSVKLAIATHVLLWAVFLGYLPCVAGRAV